METFQNTVTIRRPQVEVFAFLADFQNVPSWNYAIEQTTKTSAGPVGVGTTYRQIRTIPRRREESFHVTIFEPPTRLAIQGQIGPFHAKISYLIEPIADGTRLANDVELEPSSAPLRLIGPLAVPQVKAAVGRNLSTLKELLEARARITDRE
jgi:polyketide cyclase/dehydrase/lipid transport protein